MKSTLGITILLAMILSTTGCFRTVYRAEDLGPTVTLNRSQAGEQYVSHFEEEMWNHYFLFALVPTSEPDMRRAIERNVQPGCEVRNCTLSTK